MSSDYLFELGTEELPPTALKRLSEALCSSVAGALADKQLSYKKLYPYAAPRRLAFLITGLADETPQENVTVWGPPAKIALDEDGNATKAGLAFCQRNQVTFDQTRVESDGKVDKLCVQTTQGGEQTSQLLVTYIESALAELPIPKRMRWGASRTEFVRPVHWVVLMKNSAVIDALILGKQTNNQSRGHRFMANHTLTITQASNYAEQLRQEGKVIVDLAERQQMICSQVETLADELQGKAVMETELLDEVTALVEWPVAVAGRFDTDFLEIPSEALISSMAEHQKYFHVINNDGSLRPCFITVSNIEADNYDHIRHGNEKVIRPRLADAAFFFRSDKKVSLETRREKLKTVLFQNKLGSIYDKTERIKTLAKTLCDRLDIKNIDVLRTAELCKSDLVSSMVYEFPDMQGIAGYHYALNDNENQSVAQGIVEHYLPKYSGDSIPSSSEGAIVALADRIDTITGIFGIGQIPTGSKDPFALRRASLSILRIIIESKYDLDLKSLFDIATEQHTSIVDKKKSSTLALDYVLERLYALFEEQSISGDAVRSVMSLSLTEPLDIYQRVHAVHHFSQMSEANSLASANKRVVNILTKNSPSSFVKIDESLFEETYEHTLFNDIKNAEKNVIPLFQQRDYTSGLQKLSSLQKSVDSFFDHVLVMADDEKIKNNRISLLNALRSLFVEVADISFLVASKK